MNRPTCLFCFQTVLLAFALQSVAAANDPRLNIITPRGAQRGVEAVFTFSGARLEDAKEVLFYEPGFEVVKIEPVNANAVKVTIKIAADCRLGEHTAQIRTASGISDYRTFFVGAFPTVEEKEPNSEFETPQPVEINVTVEGIVQNEDVDYFIVDAKKGQRLSAEVEAMRLGTNLFDPYVAIMDAKRFELSASDDATLAWQDAAASIMVPEDGKYVIQIRESAYGGNGNCRYRLHIGTFPRPTAVFPPGGKLGEEVEVKFLGDPSGVITQKFPLPAEPNNNFGLFASNETGIAPSPNQFRLFEHGNAFEAEPNNTLQEATPVELPNAFNGIIETDGDNDFFRFTATKGQTYEVECYARRVRSSLDPVMVLYNAQGGQMAANDDSRGPDSYFRFSVPADGEYVIQIRDHLGRGGEDFVYRIEFQAVKPTLDLSIPRVTRYGQERQQVVIPKGNRFATLINARRNNFGGDLALDNAGLPQGVTMTALPMPANMTQMPVLFEAAPEAPVEGDLIKFIARHTDPATGISGGFTNSADLIIGDNQRIYWEKKVDLLPIAVVEEVPYHIEIVQPQAPLVRDGSMNLKVIAKRKEGFTAPIRVEFPFRPPGVNAASSVTIPEGQSEILYPLNANGNAALGDWKMYVLGIANINGEVIVSSQLADLKVAEPYVNLTLDRAAAEQGQATEMLVKVKIKTPFEGAAKATLVGLPHKVTTEVMEFNKETTEFLFKIQVDPTSPEGRHKNLFCQVVIPVNGEEVSHRVGSSEIRVDKPLPPPVVEQKPAEPMPAQPMPVAQPEPPKEKPARPLTRLEQLRLEAEQRQKGGM